MRLNNYHIKDKKVVVATHNKGKVEEFRVLFSKYDIEPMLNPLGLLIGIILGVTLLSEIVFYKISTSVSPLSNLSSTSVICLLVKPSITTNSGSTK